MKKSFQKIIISNLLLAAIALPQVAFAQQFSIVPKSSSSTTGCTRIMATFHQEYQKAPGSYNSYARFQAAAENAVGQAEPAPEQAIKGEQAVNEILACGFVTGRMRLYFWKPLVAYIIKGLSILASALAMLFITIGGYQYFMAVISGEDSDAKNTIKHAILGLVLALSSWIIVDLVQTLVSV